MSTAVPPPRKPDDASDNDRTVERPRSNETTEGQPVVGGLRTHEVVQRQKERFGGMKFGACFFGWLTATGTAVLLTALLTAAGAAFGLGQNLSVTQAQQQAQNNAQTVGLVGGIVLVVVVLLSYFAGGYVAGRMARFNGIRQGVGVWLWALIIAVVVAGLSLIAGAQFNVLANLNGFPRLPVGEGSLTTAGIITAVILLVISLIGAILGGLAGMRYHRRVDHADLTVAP